MVFRRNPDDPEWRRFWTVLRNVADGLQGQEGWTFESYLNLDNRAVGSDHARLGHDLRDHRVAGVFHAHRPIAGSMPTGWAKVPHAIIVNHAVENSLSIVIDYRDFLRKAAVRLVDLGCSRIALITGPGFKQTYESAYCGILESLRLPVQRIWMQHGNLNAPEGCANLAELLFAGPASRRPDGLLVTDDNLTLHACRGLEAIGLAPGKDVPIVSHANFPSPPLPSRGVIRLGYDNGAILRHALRYFRDCHTRGAPFTSEAVMDCVFEHSM